MVAGIYSLLRWGMQLSIDFTGGTIIQIQNVKLQDQIGTIQKFLEEKEIEVVSFNISKESINIKTKPIEREKWVDVKNQLEDDYGEIEELQFETVGPVLGKELLQKTAIAALLAVFGILFYIAYVFKDVKYGLRCPFPCMIRLLFSIGLENL
ncbi:MAG: Protein translocase subunit SecF [Candidatus Levybacteria bacterium GW2011_GWA2_40_8]|nr:MAG: Protein translocase subunit SecF [Candidatus Levybacteria bacterium GW2011_GWA2_40_8]